MGIKLGYCPCCKRDMYPAFEPPFDLGGDNHRDRCVIRSRQYRRGRTPEEIEVCHEWGQILEDKRRREASKSAKQEQT